MCGDHYQRVARCVVFIVFICCYSFSQAAVPAAYNGRMNAAVGGVIKHKTSKWGFAANDARVNATIAGVGSGLAVVAAGVVGVGVAAVSWPAILVGAAITAVVTGGIVLGQDALYKWIFNDDGTVSTTGAMGEHPWALPGLDGSMMVGGGYFGEGNCKSGSPGSTISCMVAAAFPGADGVIVGNCDLWMESGVLVAGRCDSAVHWPGVEENQNYGRLIVNFYPSGAPMSCAPYMVAGPSGCVSPFGAPVPESTPAIESVPPGDAIANIPEEELSKPLSDEMLAAAVNAAWKAQAMEGGLPWSSSDPVTPADVAQWKQANPEAVPNVADFIAPATAPAPAGSPSGSVGPVSVSPTASSPSPAPAPGPAPTPGGGEQVDLGPDPNIGAPQLEPIPTASQILGPLLDLMPDLRNFSVPDHASACPQPSFEAFNNTYTFTAHCTLAEENRALIEGAMLLVWTLASVVIVLRA